MVIEKKMSTVKRKLRNKFLKEDCEIIRLIETSIANKEASEEFEGPKITVADWGQHGACCNTNTRPSFSSSLLSFLFSLKASKARPSVRKARPNV